MSASREVNAGRKMVDVMNLAPNYLTNEGYPFFRWVKWVTDLSKPSCLQDYLVNFLLNGLANANKSNANHNPPHPHPQPNTNQVTMKMSFKTNQNC